MKTLSAVCMFVIFANFCVFCSESNEVEKIFKWKSTYSGNDLDCPTDAMCNLTSIRCKSSRDCYPAMPLCCTPSAANSTRGIRCCNPTTRGGGQPICPGNNPPPPCRSADVCTDDSQCFTGERCCRTSFGGQLLNFSCCINATRGPQCPAVVTDQTCIDATLPQCGGALDCDAGQVCCAIGDSTVIRCCVFPICPARITVLNQCVGAAGGGMPPVCGPAAQCATGEICCHPGNSPVPCCVVDPGL